MLKEKRILITGASSGIGKVISESALAEGARVYGCGLEEAIKDWGKCQLERLESLPAVKTALARGDLETGLFYFDLETLRLDRYADGLWKPVV